MAMDPVMMMADDYCSRDLEGPFHDDGVRFKWFGAGTAQK